MNTKCIVQTNNSVVNIQQKPHMLKNASTLFTLHIFSFWLHLCFTHSCKIKLSGIAFILSMLQAHQCLHLSMQRYKQNNWKKLRIELCVWELDYILVIFCNSRFFHWTLVCQVTRCGKRNNLLWLLVVNCVVLLTGMMSEGKHSILKKSLSHAALRRHLIQYTCQFDIWTANASCHIFRWLTATDEATPLFFSKMNHLNYNSKLWCKTSTR